MKFAALSKTSLWPALSHLGQSMETPKGIFYWSSRAKNEASIDGTIGIAQDDDGTISHLPSAEKWVSEKIMQRAPKAKVFGYAPIEGVLSLRQKWLNKILEKHPGLKPHAALPVVANGITHSIAIASRLLLERGQSVVTADKSWENYEHIFTGAQGVKINSFPIFTAAGSFNVGGLIKACEASADMQKKVVLLLNFPHNQTGFMPSADECGELGRRIQKFCIERPDVPFVALLDDAYEGYVYDENGQKFSPISQIFAPLKNLSVVKMDGASKVLLAYGYRIAFMTFFLNSLDGAQFNEDFLKEMSAEIGAKVGGFIRGEISQVNHHGQILADALLDEWEAVQKERSVEIQKLKERWRVMMKILDECYLKYGKSKVFADPCNSGFFGYFNLAKEIDPKILAERLLEKYKVGVVPSEQGLRVAFCGVSKEKIPQMINAIFEAAH